MEKLELLNRLRQKIKNIESRPSAKNMLKGLAKQSQQGLANSPVYIPDRPKMNWRNFLKNHCPKCNSPLMNDVKNKQMIKCTICDYVVKLETFRKISNNLHEKQTAKKILGQG